MWRKISQTPDYNTRLDVERPERWSLCVASRRNCRLSCQVVIIKIIIEIMIIIMAIISVIVWRNCKVYFLFVETLLWSNQSNLSLNKNSWFYVFDYQSKFGPFKTVRTSSHNHQFINLSSIKIEIMTRTTTFALFIIMLLYSWGSGDWYTNTEMHLRKNANKQKTKVSQGKREKSACKK